MESLPPEQARLLGPSAYSPQPPGFAAADVGGTNLRGAFLYVGLSLGMLVMFLGVLVCIMLVFLRPRIRTQRRVGRPTVVQLPAMPPAPQKRQTPFVIVMPDTSVGLGRKVSSDDKEEGGPLSHYYSTGMEPQYFEWDMAATAQQRGEAPQSNDVLHSR